MKKVVVGISGGVDSSVACILLQKAGYEVIGVTFKMLDEFDSTDAEKVANMLGIEHHIIDISDDFKNTIINSFIDDYKCGLTPNPCVLCNYSIKFKYLIEAMNKYNADYIATGHYAKMIDGSLYKSVDLNKDQTYFLSRVNKDVLNKTLFPLEGITKDEVRKIALEYNLVNANKKDSYDVCFITDKFREFLKSRVDSKQGDVINIETNEVIGKHNGLMYYTLGQRRGLDIGGNTDRLFVVGKNIEKNILYVALGDSNKYLLTNSCIVSDFNYLTDKRFDSCMAKFRYRSDSYPVSIKYLDDGDLLVSYDNIKSVTPGQTCVLYDGDICLGGGIIKTVNQDNEKVWYIL